MFCAFLPFYLCPDQTCPHPRAQFHFAWVFVVLSIAIPLSPMFLPTLILHGTAVFVATLALMIYYRHSADRPYPSYLHTTLTSPAIATVPPDCFLARLADKPTDFVNPERQSKMLTCQNKERARQCDWGGGPYPSAQTPQNKGGMKLWFFWL